MANITNFLRELRRRNVFKMGATYAIVAWLLLQVASIATPALLTAMRIKLLFYRGIVQV